MTKEFEDKYLVRFVYLSNMKFCEKYKNEVEMGYLERRKDIQILHYQKISKEEAK